MKSAPLLLHFDDEDASALRIATSTKFERSTVERHRFPDGELKLRLPAQVPEHVIVIRSLDYPNEKLVELLLLAHTARSLGARHLTLVAPYLAYMRQDIAFRPGEAVSQKIVGHFLSQLFDAVMTVDPHLHRITTLDEAIPVKHAIVLSGAPALSDLIASRRQTPLLIGPDEESAQWVSSAATRHHLDFAVCRKVRHGDHSVDIALPDYPIANRQIVLLDDVASTGRTVARATALLLAAGARSVDVAVTHALFAGDALQVMKDAGVGEVWSTDCIPHPSNHVSMANEIGNALLTLHNGQLL